MMAKERKHKPVLNKDIFDKLNNEVNPKDLELKLDPDEIGIEINEQKILSDINQALIVEISVNLNIIAKNYHKNYNNQKAVDWFNNHGIKKLNRFIELKIPVGFSDGTLIDMLSENQIDEQLKLNVLSNRNEEIFLNCITLPVVDELEQVVNIYGININDDKVKSLNETGPFNQKACKVYDEIILTESIIDALSLIELDFNNVISIEGCDNFKPEYIKILKDNRVKTVIIAFKNEVSSVFASDKIKNLLIDEGINVKIINQITCDDWNKELLAGITREDVLNIINIAETFTPLKSGSLPVKKENGFITFTIDNLTYRLAGVKDLFINSMKIHIKVQLDEETYHHDKIDICVYKQRLSFSNDTASKLNVNAVKVEKDLDSILVYLEKENAKRFKNEDENKYELTEEEKKLGLEFLKSPDIFQQIIDDMTTLGYVGEDLNKVLLYLAASSRILDDPISVMIISQSAAGKSMLIETLRKMLPAEDVIALTSLSDQALNYIGDILHKFLIMGEAVHNEQVEHQIRDMLSNHELSRLVPVKDEKTGKHKSEQFITKAIVSMALGGTKYNVNPENASRFFIVNADESKDQTDRIHGIQKDKYSIEREYIKEEVRPHIVKKHISAQRLLKKITIVNPFRVHLKFPNTTMRTRRDFERFIDLIAVACFLRQYQKEHKTDGRYEYIECDLTDYEIAYRIMINNVLPATMTDMSCGALSLYEELRKMCALMAEKKGLKNIEINFIQKEIRNYTGLNGDTVRKHLKVLVDNEYIQLTTGKTRGTRFSYKLREDKPIDKLDLSVIPTLEEMAKKLQNI